MKSINYNPMHKSWLSREILSTVDKKKILLNSKELYKYYHHMMNHLQAESDSSNLYNELLSNHVVSHELKKFLEVWHIEEQNHAAGYYQLLNILFGENEELLRHRIENKKSDFRHISEFLNDEYKLCVLFAYDEYATTMDYKKNLFYSSFGPPEFVAWIRMVIKDEARHFVNAVRLIHHKYMHRIEETRDVLDQILEVERTTASYQFTFLFDHNEDNFLLSYDELKNECASRVLKSIMRH